MERAAPDIEFSPADPAVPPAVDLIGAMVAEMQELYSLTGHVGVELDLSELAPPGGVYLVGRTVPGGEIVAGGGLRTIGESTGEIKRMYVVPAYRGSGVGAKLLAGLEAAASGMGLTCVRLDTGSRQPEARHLYEKSGYRPIANYNGNGHAAFWGEKVLG